MRAVIQRVTHASCTVEGVITGKCEKGFMVLLGFTQNDDEEVMEKVLRKLLGLRVFEDENQKMNKSLKDVGGTILAISQFTLYADCKHGFRPSFTKALAFSEAKALYEKSVEFLNREIHTECGIFGADMKIDLLNDGPVTIILDSEDL